MERRERPWGSTAAVAAVLSFGLLFWLWTLLVGAIDLQDVLAGLVTAAVATGVGWLATRQGRAIPRFAPRDLVELARMAPLVFTETAEVYAAAARHATGRPIGSRTRTVGTDVRSGGWPGARRSAVVAALQSFTPGRIVIELDTESGEALVHELHARP